MRFYLVRNPNYSTKYKVLLVLANLLDGVLSVVTLGFIKSTVVVDTHQVATGDYFKRLKEKRSNGA